MTRLIEDRALRLAFISTTAEKQIERLQPRDRRKVRTALEQPVGRDPCEKMNAADCWRVQITDGLWLTFVVIGRQACVVHIGPHGASDRYVDRKGCVVPNLQILK